MPAVSPITRAANATGLLEEWSLTKSTKLLPDHLTVTEMSKAAATDQQPDYDYDKY